MKVTITDPSFVGQYYEMDPETEDLFPTGNQLEVGMTVLVENSNYRVSLRDINVQLPTGEAQMDQARKFNRWATIEHINRSEMKVHLAVRYSDNTKRVLRVSSAEAWFVKKDSLPKVDEDLIQYAETDVKDTLRLFAPELEVEKVRFTQVGTDRTATISREELLKHGVKREFARPDRSNDIQSADGPLARALADHETHVNVPIGDYARTFPHAKVTGRLIEG